MPQSLSRILIHLVFSTKNRERVLTPAIQTELHPCLTGTIDNIECPSLQVGGVEDHVHFFFGLSRTRTIADVVETVKTRRLSRPVGAQEIVCEPLLPSPVGWAKG